MTRTLSWGGEKELDFHTIENDSFWIRRGHENLLVSRHFVSVAMNEYMVVVIPY